MTTNIQKKISHVVVLMMENRSFDNLIGWNYGGDNQPKHFIPQDTPGHLRFYNGLYGVDYSNPLDLDNPSTAVKITKGVANLQVPNPDPNEAFKHMNQQLFGTQINKKTEGWLPSTEGETPNMQGFLADYVSAKCSNKNIAPQIMQTYAPETLSVMCGLATGYAVSDNYHASCPTQTWPNRAFMHAGTSEGNVNNAPYFPYGSKTIFNVLEDADVSWKVYKSSEIIPSLTRIQMDKLWDPLLDDHFQHVSQFIDACQSGNLPAYSFIEPSFVIEKDADATSEHPPANVCAGDHFLQTISTAIINSPAFKDTLFIINFDEHGGCPDHVAPNWTAVSPDKDSDPGKLGFRFNRYGVRVPAIFVTPYASEATLIRATTDPWSKSSVPYDHTSILAMLLDWKNIDRAELPSERVMQAPPHPFDELLAGAFRLNCPSFKAQCTVKKESCWDRLISFFRNLFGLCAEGYSLTSLQQSIIAADAHYRAAKRQNFAQGVRASQQEIDGVLAKIKTQADMVKYFKSLNVR